MSTDVFADAFEKLLAIECTPRVVRGIEAGFSPDALWAVLQESGFADALVPESQGGSGLSLREALPLFLAAGAAAIPVPLAFTMVARAVLADARVDWPLGPITFAAAKPDASGAVRAASVPWGLVSDAVLIDAGDHCLLLPVARGTPERAGPFGTLAANITWSATADAVRIDGELSLRHVAAALLAAQMAGAMLETLRRSVAYANERKQFGKSIGKFQAIQQQLSAVAQQVFAAHTAAEIGCTGGWQDKAYRPVPVQAAVAKARCSDAVVTVATVAHAVHGAIGVTLEYDLHLLTRRLHEWRIAFGGERHWHRELGTRLLAGGLSKLDFIRERIAAEATVRGLS